MTSIDIAIRWGDLDPLKHVNNVVYVDFALEAWPDLRANGLIPHGDPRHMQVDYRLPVFKTDEPLHIDNAVDSGKLTQSMFVPGSEQPAAIVTAYFNSAVEPAKYEPALHTGSLMLRFSDLDDRGRINPARLFELFQEARVLFINEVMKPENIPAIVIARSDVFFIEPVRWQTAPLATQTWVKHMGNSSFIIRAQISVDGKVLAVAETVMVAFSAETQRASLLTGDQRAELRALMLPE